MVECSLSEESIDKKDSNLISELRYHAGWSGSYKQRVKKLPQCLCILKRLILCEGMTWEKILEKVIWYTRTCWLSTKLRIMWLSACPPHSSPHIPKPLSYSPPCLTVSVVVLSDTGSPCCFQTYTFPSNPILLILSHQSTKTSSSPPQSNFHGIGKTLHVADDETP